jgi:hypothetical protein
MLRLRIGYPAIDDEKQILRDREYSDPLTMFTVMTQRKF